MNKIMENLTSFGYEQENGYIHYVKTHLMTIDDSIQYLLSRTAPKHDSKIIIADSIQTYFQNNCELQVLYMLNGSVKIRKSSYFVEFECNNLKQI
jgi:hypothetical protein